MSEILVYGVSQEGGGDGAAGIRRGRAANDFNGMSSARITVLGHNVL